MINNTKIIKGNMKLEEITTNNNNCKGNKRNFRVEYKEITIMIIQISQQKNIGKLRWRMISCLSRTQRMRGKKSSRKSQSLKGMN